MSVKVQPEINVNRTGQILLVGRDPGADEEIEGRPFVGRAGEELEKILVDAGIRRKDVNITNVVPWRPFNNDFKKHKQKNVEQGLTELYALIEELQPRLIIAMGNEANYALVEDWPTQGRGIFGAKSIQDRRGYFWRQPSGVAPVLSTLHPATVTRQAVPNRALITNDMLRARQYLRGELRTTVPPLYRTLRFGDEVLRLERSVLLGVDIETYWDMTKLLCCGFCGDDGQPYVAKYGAGFTLMRKVMQHPVHKVFHNGWGFDIPFFVWNCDLEVVGYEHDTQHMWHALEPELAGKDTQDEGDGDSRLTRKGLAFLATLAEPYSYDIPWWKNYPDKDDPEYREKMYVLNAHDAYYTRLFADHLLTAVEAQEVNDQYRLGFEAGYPCMVVQKRGIPINDEERRRRIKRLAIRSKTLLAQSTQAALKYIEDNDLEFFKDWKQCTCCGGGKIARERCWRCAGFEKKPGKKELLELGSKHDKLYEHDLSTLKKDELEDFLLGPCAACGGEGKTYSYHFNPRSWQQLEQLLYVELQTPKSTWKGKTTTNEQAMMRVLRWAQARKQA